MNIQVVIKRLAQKVDHGPTYRLYTSSDALLYSQLVFIWADLICIASRSQKWLYSEASYVIFN